MSLPDITNYTNEEKIQLLSTLLKDPNVTPILLKFIDSTLKELTSDINTRLDRIESEVEKRKVRS
jgi:hypothetical protein